MPITRAEETKKYLKKPELKEFIDFYLMLKRVDRAEYTKKEEFKKNVRLVVMDDNGITYEINIEKLYEFYEKTKDFIRYVEENYK